MSQEMMQQHIPMKIYVVEYRYYSLEHDNWTSDILDLGFWSYEDARRFCIEKSDDPGSSDRPFNFHSISIEGRAEEYRIHAVHMR